MLQPFDLLSGMRVGVANEITKGRSILFNHFIDMRTTINLFISCRKNVFLLENFNKNRFFLHEMDKLTVVLMSIKWLNKIERPLVMSVNLQYMKLDPNKDIQGIKQSNKQKGHDRKFILHSTS